MKTWCCPICGYIIEKEKPKFCPVCNSTCENFKLINENDEESLSNKNNIGIARDSDENMICELRNIFSQECLEVGTYLAMSEVANQEGYSKISDTLKEIAYEEANHASIMAQFLGEVIRTNTKDNLEMIIEGEYEATQAKLKLSKRAKEMGLDTIYNTLNKMCKDEAKHGKVFSSLLSEFFTQN